MADDGVAGIYTLISLQVARLLIKKYVQKRKAQP